ncbi:MAG: hypothetical protein OXC84_04030, partial [Gammaproteobacteria bacterium]|nr:hypothetical protein [Gammaproteobacteria bacterium]
NAPKPSANTLVNETSLIKHNEENPGKPTCLLRDSGMASVWPAEGSQSLMQPSQPVTLASSRGGHER